MYMYDRKVSGAPPLIEKHLIASWPAEHNSYYSGQVISRFLGNSGTGSFSSACDPSVATPGFLAAEQSKLTSLLSPSQSAQAIQWNRQMHPAKSGVRPE